MFPFKNEIRAKNLTVPSRCRQRRETARALSPLFSPARRRESARCARSRQRAAAIRSPRAFQIGATGVGDACEQVFYSPRLKARAPRAIEAKKRGVKTWSQSHPLLSLTVTTVALGTSVGSFWELRVMRLCGFLCIGRATNQKHFAWASKYRRRRKRLKPKQI